MTYLLIASILINIFFIYYCIKFALIIIKVQATIENSLDKIDRKYNRISQITKIPVFYDSPEIKKIIQEIIEVQDVVYEIALDLSQSTSTKKTKEETYLEQQNEN